MKSGFFITGTDTDIGKTVCSALIVTALLEQGRKVGYWKPIQTGQDSDRRRVLELSGLSEERSPHPCYKYTEPMAPSRAAKLHGETIHISQIANHWNDFPSDRFWIVEGAGGLLVPLAGKETMADFAQSLELRLVIVAGTRLGTMNHLLLTLEAAKTRGLKIAGVFLVGNEDSSLEESLEPWLRDIPWIQRVPRIPGINPNTIQAHAKMLLNSVMEHTQ